MAASPASACAPDAARLPCPTPHRGWRQIPAALTPRFLAIAWPHVLAVAVSTGATVDGHRLPAGSVVVVDEHHPGPRGPRGGGCVPATPEAVLRFAWRNRFPPAGFGATPVPALAAIAHVAVVAIPRQAAGELAAAMLAAAGTSAPAVYASARCARFWAAPGVTDALALACWVARDLAAR
jgi:hypothetical protein